MRHSPPDEFRPSAELFSAADLCALATPTNPGSHTALVGGKLQYTPQPGWSGLDWVPFTVSDGRGKSSSSWLRVEVAPPPASGYFKTPNLAGKAAVPVADASQLQTVLGQFSSGFYSPARNYVQLTQDFGASATKGANINLNVGGNRADPLVITRAGAGGNDWSSVPRIFNSSLVAKAPWLWFHGLWCQMLPTGTGVWNTVGDSRMVQVQAGNCFVTACRLSGSKGVYTSGPVAGMTCNHNWYDLFMQATAATGEDGADYGFRGESTTAGVVTGLTHSYNYYSDYGGVVRTSRNCRGVIIGNGLGSTINPVRSLGTEVSWNFLDCANSHHMEFKNAPDMIVYNHCTARGSPYGGINTRGSQADGIPPFRPLCAYNRVHAQHWEANARHWDYVSNIQTGGNMLLLPHEERHVQPSKDNPISGAEGIKLIGHAGDVVMPYLGFEPGNFDVADDLGSLSPILIAASAAGGFKDDGGATINFSGDPGNPTGGHARLRNAGITKQSAVPAGYSLGTPPTLDATTTGPAAGGATWAG